jgi:hypothetical protein
VSNDLLCMGLPGVNSSKDTGAEPKKEVAALASSDFKRA